jgi:hypothetical protein
MALKSDRKWEKVTVDQAVLDQQIADLEQYNVVFDADAPPEEDVRKALYLEWPENCTTGMRAATLGMYARWLIAARLLLIKSGNDVDLSTALEKNNAYVRQLFATVSENRKIRDSNRYNPRANQPKGDRLTAVLLAIIAKWNAYFAANNQKRKITVDEFFEVRVLIATPSAVVGNDPVRSFEHWLETGKRQAVPAPDDVPVRDGKRGPFVSELQRVVDVILNPVEKGSEHQIIANITCADGVKYLTNFAADLNEALIGKRSIVWIRLSSGASRVDVLKSLYSQCQIPFSPEAFDARPIDLARDLKQIRDYLTAEPVVVVFRDWDNVGRTFEALHDYLCNTHWGELIRILAQPSQERLLSAKNASDPLYRIVVFSSQTVNDLKPWVAFGQNLVVDGETGGVEFESTLMQLGEARKAWYLRNVQWLGEPDDGEIFLLGALSVSALEELGCEFGVLPEGASRRRAVRLALMRKWLTEFKPKDYELRFLKFAAVSINGMRRSTMYRCIKQLSVVTGAKFKEHVDSEFAVVIEGFLKRFDGLIEEVDDEDVEGLPAHCRSIDLDEPPRSTPFMGNPAVLKKSMRFRTKEWCGIFTEAWLGQDKNGINEITAGGRWVLINFVLAEECMRQATAQMHHLEAGAMDNAYTTRRLVQTIYHGLMSLDCPLTADFSEKFVKFGLTALTLPTEPGKRFRYLYTFLYRHCVEEDQWRLGRAFGRSDVRLDLLIMFVARDKGYLMVTGGDATIGAGLLPLPYHVESPKLPTPDPDVPDPVLRCDLLEALGRAGLDHGGALERLATEWALSILPGWRLKPAFGKGGEKWRDKESHEINALLPARDEEYYRYADDALRLRLDYLQSSGVVATLAEAGKLCEDQLDRIGFDREFLKHLRGHLKVAIEMIWQGKADATIALDQVLATALGDLRDQSKLQHKRQGIADVLARLGKITATNAHNLESGRAGAATAREDLERENSVILEFAQASAVCWLADRLRSDANTDPDIGLTWPAARGRSLRYYIRVCMKLARLVMAGNEVPVDPELDTEALPAWKVAAGLLGHARNRLGVYTRHHFRYRRERVSMLLLDSARVRCWVRVNLEMEQAKFEFVEKKFYQRSPQINAELKQLKMEYSKYGVELRHLMRAVRGVKGAGLNRHRIAQLEGLIVACKEKEAVLLHEMSELKANMAQSKSLLLDSILAQHDTMKEAIIFASEAETLLLSLGFQPAHARRLFLERIKNAIAFVKIADMYRCQGGGDRLLIEARAYFSMAKCALSALRDVSSGSKFWEGIQQGQGHALARLQQTVDKWP